jgi:hypothetical protein
MLDGANNNDDVIGQRAGTQARTAIESVQEFQVITNQFDAQFGRTTGAVINAVTKQGTNAFRGSAFGYFQDAELTERDFFASSTNLSKPDTSQQQFGGTMGGPIVRDRAHFFFSLERVRIDEGITINIPARPEFNHDDDRARDARVEHGDPVRPPGHREPHVGRELAARGVAAAEPDHRQRDARGRQREEFDIDQTVVGTFNSVLGNTRVNTVAVAWTQEDVAFANPCFNTNGRNQAACRPTLAFQTFTTQQSTVAQARSTTPTSWKRRSRGSSPGRRGDHDIKFGVQWQYSRADRLAQDNLNGTFSFSSEQRAVRRGGPAHLSRAAQHPRPGRARNFLKSQSSRHLRAGQVEASAIVLTLTLGLRYDIEKIPMPQLDNFAVR